MLTQRRLKKLLSYNPKTGLFRRLTGKHKHTKCGSVKSPARSKTSYMWITVDDESYCAHRLAFLYMTGAWPKKHIDHIDHDGLNNSWGNLREATPSQNQVNTDVYRSNKVGLKGVHVFNGRFRAMISVNSKNKHIGYFDTPDEAAAAYRQRAVEIYGEYVA